MTHQKITRCLISVSDKSSLVELAQTLIKFNVEIISTGGTAELLRKNQIPLIAIEDFSGFPEIMDGRVKTLLPKIHGGLLGILDNKKHQDQAKQHDILPIDLLVVNFYPFENAVASGKSEEEIIENIDIGGPALVRSAGKNFAYKTVVTDAAQYPELIAQLEKNQGSVSFELRKKFARAAFKRVAEYDSAISNWFNQAADLNLELKLKQSLRYGENPQQKATLYTHKDHTGIVGATQLQGKELSYNNLADASAAYELALEFEQPVCVIVKHANPCAVAVADDAAAAFEKAFNADSKSAFGGIVVINRKLDAKAATAIAAIFFEVVVVPAADADALEIMAKKKNLRVLTADFKKTNEPQVKSIAGGFLIQDADDKKFSKTDLKQVSKVAADAAEVEQLLFALKVCKHAKSNAIVIANNSQTIGIGSGQTNRSDACLIACKKAQELGVSAKYLASDAFFPFTDNIEIASEYGVKAIVAPAGSIRDEEVIAKADELGIALYFINTRHFKH